MWPALMIRSPSLKFLLLLLVLAQRQISSLFNIFFSHKSFSHLCCIVKIPRLATPFCIFRDITCMSYILCLIPMCIPENTSHNFPCRSLCFQTLWCTFTRFNPLFWPFTWFRSIVVDPHFIYRHKSKQKLFRIAVKIGQSLLWSGHMIAFLVDCEHSRHPSCTELSHAQMCMQNIDHTFSWDGYDLSYLTHF